MRTKRIKPIAAATVIAALAVFTSPGAAHAAPSGNVVGGTPVPISVVLSKSLAATAYGLKDQKSGLFLQPKGGSTANGTTVVQEGYTGGGIQGWYVVSDGSYISLNNYSANRNLGTSGTSTAAGTSAVIVNGSSSYDQDWYVDAKDSTYFRLKNRKDSTKCLGISGASRTAGAVAAIYACDSTTNQTWSFT